MSTFNLYSKVCCIESTEAIAMTLRTGMPVYMTEAGKLSTRKPVSPSVKILEPIDLTAYGVEFRQFSAAEDHLGEHGGWGFTYQGETLCFGWDASDKADTAHHIASDLGLFSDIERRLAELHDMLMVISRHSYDSEADWDCANDQTDIPALLESLQ